MAARTAPSTLGHRANGSAGTALATYAREQARIATSLAREDHNAARHASALSDFAQFVSSRDRSDERLYVIWNVAAFMGATDPFEPGPRQREFFARLGAEGIAHPIPLVSDSLEELAAAAVDDAIVHAQEKHGDLRQAVQRAEALAEGAAKERERADAAEAKAADVASELEAAQVEITELGGQVSHLQARELTHPPGPPHPLGTNAPSPKKSEPRRIKVKDHTGIYTKDSKRDGKRFEIGYTDPITKKQAWLTLDADTSLEEAIQTRKELSEPLEVPA